MPVDNKRITGPEVTIPYDLFVKSTKELNEVPLSKEVRKDNRKFDEHRKICKFFTRLLTPVPVLRFRFKNRSSHTSQRFSLHRSQQNKSYRFCVRSKGNS